MYEKHLLFWVRGMTSKHFLEKSAQKYGRDLEGSAQKYGRDLEGSAQKTLFRKKV
jgi:hypothetical protein